MKKLTAILLAAALLCGCKFGNTPESGDTSEATPASETTTAASAGNSPAEFASLTDNAKPEEETEFTGDDDQQSLEEFILEAAQHESNYDSNSNHIVIPLMYEDFDGDGRNELIAIYGWKFDISDKENCASGKLWYASEKTSARFSSAGTAYGVCLDEIGDLIEIKNIDGHSIAFIKEKSAGYAGDDYQYTYLYEISGGNIRELEISGKFGRFTDLGGNNFSAVKFDRDSTRFYTGEITWKNYWFYFENGEFKEYVGDKITQAAFMNYGGGKAFLNGIVVKGGDVTNIFYRRNGIVNVNYIIVENGTLCNKFFAVDVSSGNCKEIESVYGGETNNYGVYLQSVLDPKLGLPEEQLALYKLIEEKAADSEGEIVYPIFGDFDGDGKNELIAIYKKPSDFVIDDVIESQKYGDVWFASGDSAECIAGNGSWLPPRIVTSRGNTFLKMENCAFTTSSISCYFQIKNSTAKEYSKLDLGQGVYPDGEHGDFTAVHDSYDMSFEFDKDGNITGATGHTWKTYWYYNLDDSSENYKGVNISREEFLKYNGAKEILDEIENEEYEIDTILKRGNGIINISYFKRHEAQGIDGYYIVCQNKTIKYRNGKVIDITEKSGYDDGGPYGEYDGEEPIPDFEKFSAMIYDTAEGNEDSALLDRFYGDIDGDGKNELYAYYGTAEKFELWFADENGAKRSDEPYELITLDGDVLLKKLASEENEDDTDSKIYEYYVIRGGKSVPVYIFGAKNMIQTENGDFTGYITVKDALSDGSEETSKEYWFYYRNGRFHHYSAKNITEEELAEYRGTRAFLDEIASMGGEVTGIILRDNRIININYDAEMQNVTMHYYFTIRLDDKDRAEDITPRNPDGTLNNKGFYKLR